MKGVPRILISCEFSGIVRDEFLKLGFDTYSCDLLPCERPGPHFQTDIFNIINDRWDLMIAFPPCVHLAASGARHFKFKSKEQAESIEFVKKLWNAPIKRICIENPVGILSTVLRKPDQIIHPYYFGESFSKRTCLWLKNLPLLIPTDIVYRGDFVTFKSGKKMSEWMAKSKSISDKEQRFKLRSRTFQGIAAAMAAQWSKIL